ncbi:MULTISPECIES: FeoA family protein [unclassified Adlercreutzia]|uniref:FeoA family protein n=1 Tax=unclassified Adlercreutzia TaxID=2636013 RepID=UPI001F14FA5B|nr:MULTISPECIES: FeoA family protein [unclassified Adlercreutzia]
MAVENHAFAPAEPKVRMQQMPLTFLNEGSRARVVKVRGKGDVHHHLENLGFVEGADVRVVSGSSGNLIVEVKGARVALDKSVASKIITC